MSQNLTFSGTPNAAYTVPGTHIAYDGTWNYDGDGTGIVTGFARIFDTEICSGACSVEIQVDFTVGASYWSNAGVQFLDSSLTGFKVEFRGDRIEIVKEVSGSSGATIYSASATNDTAFTILVDFDQTTGDINVYKAGSLVTSASYTDTLSGLRAGAAEYTDGGTSIPIKSLITVTGGSSVVIDDEPADIRISSSRIIRVTPPTTAITTGNTSIYINADTNAAITPTSVTTVTGLTVDIAFTVPDQYAGLKYTSSGYPIIVSTVDGDATSGNVPFLPATGNNFIDATSVPGDFSVTSGTLAIGDQIEYETLGGTVSVNSALEVTYTGADPTGLSFDARAWDATDSTWGALATISLEDALGSTTPPVMPSDTSVSVAENTTTVGTFTASTGTSPITYAISGTDSALFSINSSTGAVAFLSAQDYEAGSNTKSITVTATNAYGSDSQNITVNITNVVEVPVMPADATIVIAEGGTVVINTGADFVDGVVTYTKGGTNQALFNINSSTGALSFAAPATIGTYTVSRTATNSAGSDTQVLTVNVVEQLIGTSQSRASISIGISI